MNRKKILRKERNLFDIGGLLPSGPVGGNIVSQADITDLSKISELGKGGASGRIGIQPTNVNRARLGFGIDSIGGIASALGGIAQTGLFNAQTADTSGIEAQNKAQKNMVVGASSNDDLMSEWSAWNKLKDNYSWRDVRGGSTGQRAINTIGAAGQGAVTGASVGGPIGAIVGGVAGLGSSIAGWFTGNRKAKKKANKLNQQAKRANERALNSFETRADNIDKQDDFNIMANYSAFGGVLGGDAIDYELTTKALNNKQLDVMSKFRMPSMPNSFEVPELGYFADGGKIHIKKKNRGKFTEYCGGKVTEECIRKGKNSSNPTTRKRATFADNARGWNHADGGYMGHSYNENYAPIGTLYTGAYDSLTTHPDALTNGGVFSDGVTVVGEGGSHEENPLTGVPMGVAPDGQPNLVEEGEVVFNDYVFSNRLHPSEDLLKAVNLPSKYKDNTFASIAEKINKEPKERPYDPIAKRGLLANMSKLMQAQEEVKAIKGAKTEGRQFANGGDTESNDTQPSSTRKGIGLDALRYAPALGAGVGVMSDLFGWTNKPDYSNADMIVDAVSGLPTIEAEPIGNYLSYNPFDRDFYINKLNQQSSATRRALQNTSGGNRLNAQAGILAADYNYGQNMGDLARQAEEYNLAQRERVESFNRGTNQYNSESALRAAGMNQQNREMKLRAIMQAAGMREEVGARSSAAKSANLTNFVDSLGDIGREEFSRNMIESNPALDYTIDRSGKVRYKKPKSDTKSKKKSKGGYLTYGK